MSTSVEQCRDNMQTRLRWAADAATNAYISGGVPDVYDNINEIARYIRDAQSALENAKIFLDLLDDAITDEDNA